MASANQGDTVHIHYTGRFEDGTVFDSSEGRAPLEFVLGSGQVIPGFDRAVDGMEIGEEKTVTVEASDAYGERREDLVINVSRTDLPDGLEPDVGQHLQMSTPDGQTFQVSVVDTSDTHVVLDANHPLAGKDLTFDIQLVKTA
ncbi:MAG: peptidylprolyl isomerase [Gemmatimonadota bacterium]|jgi:FKBP-type peptidyl-prolyl cis-trans isomerase 2